MLIVAVLRWRLLLSREVVLTMLMAHCHHHCHTIVHLVNCMVIHVAALFFEYNEQTCLIDYYWLFFVHHYSGKALGGDKQLVEEQWLLLLVPSHNYFAEFLQLTMLMPS